MEFTKTDTRLQDSWRLIFRDTQTPSRSSDRRLLNYTTYIVLAANDDMAADTGG